MLSPRKSPRLEDYDYTQTGAYFVTICTHQRTHLLGRVLAEAMEINEWGQVAQACWEAIPVHFPIAALDAFVVMPNHVHGIIVISGKGVSSVGATHGSPLPTNIPVSITPQRIISCGPPPGSLSAIVEQFKSSVSRIIKRLPNAPDHPIWQRSFHDRIIRREGELNAIRAYIAHNPARWSEDTFFT